MLAVAAAAAGIGAWATARGSASAPAVPAAAARGLHVDGNRLVDARGAVVVLHGVNRSGTEYACLHGAGMFDGPSDATSVAAMAAWHVNFVRVPLNEDCWLGINGVPPATSGAAYRSAITDYVRLLHRHGMYVELALMWGAPGSYQATYQSGSPDADHSPTAWASIASAFRNDDEVILAPWGETVADASCFRDGGVCAATFGPANTPYRTAGMQQAVDVMRRAGYAGPIAIPGVAYANDLSGWLSHEPHDPDHQIVAEAHVYGNNSCATSACLDHTVGPVADRVPVVFGEMGESYDASDCGFAALARITGWAEGHGVGYAAWAWDTWGNCSSLIASYAGQPAGPLGTWLRAHYALNPPGPAKEND